MKYAIYHSENPGRNIPGERPRAHCDYDYERIAHEVGAALKRCLKGKGLKTA